MKVLFVDIDGPLVTVDKPQETKFGRMNVFDEKCVAVLNDIWRFTGCEIVISSDWVKNIFDSKLQVARNVFKFNNVQAPIIGFIRKTEEAPHLHIDRTKIHPSLLEVDRIYEINEWVRTHNPDSWVAIDDMNLKELGELHFVLIDPIEGLAQAGIKDRIIELLG